ncbi:MAG TPA: DUF3592 domain-containing protein [Chryseosolibacter sp.]|nr:DUF3592 domain-containing protein [Chryseosolibacter sp.]
MTGEAKQEVERLLRLGERDRAIQYLDETFKVSRQDANTLVETLEREMGLIPENPQPAPTATTSLDGELKTSVAQLLAKGRKLEAVKLVKKDLNLGLRESLLMVEEVAREVNPSYVSFNLGGCFQMVAKGLGVFMMIVSVMMLVAAGLIYFFQTQSIGNSERVTGVVTEMRALETGETAPVVQYEWKGNNRSYESTYYSSPPDYYVGQSVSLYVNRDDQDDIILDTFSDRYALIVGLAVPGVVFLVVSIVLLYFGRRKF